MNKASAAVFLTAVTALGLADCPVAADEADDFEAIESAIRDRLYEHAAEKANEYLRTYPDSDCTPKARLFLGIARFRTGSLKKALEALRRAGKTAEDVSVIQDTLYWQGECLLESGKHDEAAKKLKQLLRKHPGSGHAGDALYALAWSHAGAGRKKEGIETLRRLLKNHPDFGKKDVAAFKIGKWSYDLKRYRDSSLALESFAQQYPNSLNLADALYWAGESWFQLRKWKRARLDYEKAAAASRDPLLRAHSRYGLAWVLAESGQTTEAIRALRELRYERIPDDVRASSGFRLAEVLFSVKRFREAADLYSALVEHPRYGARARFWLGECFYRMQQHKQAIKAYETVPQSDTDLYRNALDRMGSCYIKLGDYGNARKKLTRAVAAATSPAAKAHARARLADMTFNEKKYDQAAREYREALEDGPDAKHSPHILYWLALSLQKLDRHEKAANAYRTLVKEFPSAPLARKGLEKLARTYVTMQKYPEAAVAYRKLAENEALEDETRRVALYQVAQCLFNAKEYDKAFRGFEKAVAALPGTDLAKQALYGKAMCRQASGKLDEANREFREFVRKHSSDELAPKAALLLANNLYKRSRFDEAAKAYRDLISGYPGAAEIDEAYYWLGLCFRNMGNLSRAAAVWTKAAEQREGSPHRADMLLGAAEALWKQGKHPDAAAIFLGLLGSDTPEAVSQRAHTGYADMLQTQGKYEEALNHYTAAIEGPVPSIRVKARFGMAESHYHRRDYRAALDSYGKVSDLQKDFEAIDLNARIKMARCLEKLGKVEEAMEFYGKIVEAGGAEAEKAKALLDDLEKKEK
jgi:TolA-binding protein